MKVSHPRGTARTSVSGLWICLLLFLVTGVFSFSQSQPGTVTGRIADSGGAVLKGARIVFEPNVGRIVTDGEGLFTVRDVLPGQYTVTVSYVGFKDFVTSITVAASQVVRLDAVMSVATKGEEIMVYAERPHGDAEAINRELTADNILQVLPADVITSLPNANVADALGRMPGVSLERDEGEGKYVQIRGLEPRLTNVTIDGINVPSPEADVRQIKLDAIPSDIVESVEVNKTLQADQDGDGIGGSVNIRTKTAGELPTLTAFGIGGYTPIIGGRTATQFGTTLGDRFGTNKKFGILIGGTYDYNGRGIDDIEPSPDGGYIAPYYDSIDLREYRYNRTRWGLGGSMDYKLNEGSMLFLRYMYSDFKDDGDKWVYTLNDGDVPQFSTSDRVPDFAIANLVLGGHHVFTTSWFSWEASIARSAENGAAGDPGAKFKFNPDAANSGFQCAFDPAATTDIYRPQFDPACTAANSPTFDPSEWKLKSLAFTQGATSQLNLLASADWAKRYKLGNHFAIFQIGAKIRNAHKGQDAYESDYTPNGTLAMTPFVASFHNNDYYNGSYRMGPLTDWSKITTFFSQNPGLFSFDSSDSHLNSDPGNFDLIERISAGYVMNTIDFGCFRFVVGLRMEGTQVSTRGFHVSDDINGNWIATNPVYGEDTYINALPSASLRFHITDNSDIRAVYGRGVARPNPYDLVPYVVVDQSTNPWSVAVGTPGLKAETANNYDLLYEQYLKPLGLIQGGFFYKQLTNPIVQSITQNGGSALYPGPGGQDFSLVQMVNASSGYVGGVELSYQQQLSRLPGYMGGLGISANYIWSFSQASGIPNRSDSPRLQRQAPNNWNISPTYDRGPFSLRVGLTYNGASIYQYQWADGTAYGPTGPAGDIYFYPHYQVDAQGSYRLPRGFEAIVYGLNINNEVFGFYTGSPQYVLQREFYKPTIAAGLRWTYNPEHK